MAWITVIGRHRQFSDAASDPHSPLLHGGTWRDRWNAFWHSHIARLLSPTIMNAARFAPDLTRDVIIFRLPQRYLH